MKQKMISIAQQGRTTTKMLIIFGFEMELAFRELSVGQQR